MNKFCFKTVFSARLGTLVAVGEHANSQGKANGAHGAVSPGAEPFGLARNMSRFMGVLTASFVWVALAWAQPALNALPKGAVQPERPTTADHPIERPRRRELAKL
jgi:hypothetical protein